MNTTLSNDFEDGISVEILITLIGVFINCLLQLYSIYSQKNHLLICKNTLCCGEIHYEDSE